MGGFVTSEHLVEAYSSIEVTLPFSCRTNVFARLLAVAESWTKLDPSKIDATTQSGRAKRKVMRDRIRDGYQFAAMSDILGIPCCPTFNITAQGTGLTLWAGDITADTPIVNLNLVKVG